MIEATLSSKNQIVIPAAARKALGVKAGDKLVVTVRGNSLIILRKPASYSAAIAGLAQGVYPAAHLAQERKSWERNS